jgi:hypothetical protein
LRPTIPKNAHAKLAELLQKCWQQDPAQRPDFSKILGTLQKIAEEVCDWHFVLAYFNASWSMFLSD